MKDRVVVEPDALGQEQPAGHTVLMAGEETVIVAEREHASRTSTFLFEVVAEREKALGRITPVALIFSCPAFGNRFRGLRGRQAHGSTNQACSVRNGKRRASKIL